MSSPDQPEEKESLLSKASLNLSLAPPRAPPYDTTHRSLYTNKDTSTAIALHPHQNYRHYNRSKELHPKQKKYHETIHDYVSKFQLNRIPHPHLSFSPESADQLTRLISTYILPLHLQNKLRDNGTFRSLSDNAVTMSVPSLALINPKAVKRFVALSSTSQPTLSSFSTNMLNLPYGNVHPSQKVDLFLPPPKIQTKDIKGLVFFVVSMKFALNRNCILKISFYLFLIKKDKYSFFYSLHYLKYLFSMVVRVYLEDAFVFILVLCKMNRIRCWHMLNGESGHYMRMNYLFVQGIDSILVA